MIDVPVGPRAPVVPPQGKQMGVEANVKRVCGVHNGDCTVTVRKVLHVGWSQIVQQIAQLRFPNVTERDKRHFRELAVDLFDVDEQVVVSLDEVGGSNAYLTRDQVGRALYNCIVLGRRLDILPLNSSPKP